MSTEPRLLNVPASLFDELQQLLSSHGYTLENNGSNTMYRVKEIPRSLLKCEASEFFSSDVSWLKHHT